MPKMEIWANMPVQDIDRTKKFFTQLGFKPNGPNTSKELASFIFSDDAFVIHFFSASHMSNSLNTSNPSLTNGSEIMFSIAATTIKEVDEWKTRVLEAGGTIFEEPNEMEIGYNLGFADPDGHRWNVFYCKPGYPK